MPGYIKLKSVVEKDGVMYGEPAEEYEPVVHGHWVNSGEIIYMPQCTNCGARPIKGYIPSVEEVSRTYKFCPHCGAKMDEEEPQK